MHISPEDHFEDTWSLGLKLRRTVCEDTWASADTCRAKTAKAHPERTALAKALSAVKPPRGRHLLERRDMSRQAKTIREDRSRQDTWRCELTWASACPPKTRGMAKTRVQAQTLPEDGAQETHLPPDLSPTGRGEDTWLHKNTWRHEDTCQNVASVAHAASSSHVASPDVASGRGVTTPRGVTKALGVTRCGVTTRRHEDPWRHQMSRQDVTSHPVTKTLGVTRCCVRTWRHEPMWHQRASHGGIERGIGEGRHSSWRRYQASQATERNNVTGKGATGHISKFTCRHRTWRQKLA